MKTPRSRAPAVGLLAVAASALLACSPAEPAAPTADAPEGLSVLLIVVDTLRADHLGTYGYERPTSPNIDAWAARGAVFEHAQSAAAWTLPSMASLLSGQLPSRHTAGVERDEAGELAYTKGRKSFQVLPSEVETVAETLTRHGYTTAAFVTNPYLNRRFGLDQGFALYEHGGVARAEALVDHVLDWFAGDPARPFFVLAHFFDPHLPYQAGGDFAGRFTREHESAYALPVKGLAAIRAQAAELPDVDRAFVTAAYDEEIAYLDAELGRLLATLEERGILEHTLVVLTSDHGEELFDHGGFEHGHTMYQELLHVPLVVVGPGVLPCRIEATTSSLDVAATILDAAGARPEQPILGRPLLPALRSGSEPEASTVVSEGNLYEEAQRALLRWPHKYSEGNVRRLFDLARDPGEHVPLDDPELAEELRAELEGRIEMERELAAEASAAELDPETLERLRELGYVED